MRADNTWLDTETYVTLTASALVTMAAVEDNETNSYIPPPANIPFTISYLFPTLYATSPPITEFPIKIYPLMDIGCPCSD